MKWIRSAKSPSIPLFQRGKSESVVSQRQDRQPHPGEGTLTSAARPPPGTVPRNRNSQSRTRNDERRRALRARRSGLRRPARPLAAGGAARAGAARPARSGAAASRRAGPRRRLRRRRDARLAARRGCAGGRRRRHAGDGRSLPPSRLRRRDPGHAAARCAVPLRLGPVRRLARVRARPGGDHRRVRLLPAARWPPRATLSAPAPVGMRIRRVSPRARRAHPSLFPAADRGVHAQRRTAAASRLARRRPLVDVRRGTTRRSRRRRDVEEGTAG